MQTDSCIACGSNDFKIQYGILKNCSVCGHSVALDLDLANLAAKDIYDQGYFQGKEYFDYKRDRVCFERNFKARLGDVLKYCSAGKLLEIGSAYGFFLNLASKHFSVTGFEVCEEAAEYARKNFSLDVKSDNFLQENLPPESFDVACMWDVLEHLKNPQDFIEKISKIIKKDAVLALTTGDISSLNARLQGKRWRLIHPPTHIHYFSRESITRLLNKFGLRVIDVSYPGSWRSIRQISFNLFCFPYKGKENIFRLVNSSPLANINIYFNFFDIMQVVAKKSL